MLFTDMMASCCTVHSFKVSSLFRFIIDDDIQLFMLDVPRKTPPIYVDHSWQVQPTDM